MVAKDRSMDRWGEQDAGQNNMGSETIFMDRPIAIVALIIGILGLVLLVSGTTYVLVRKRQRRLSGGGMADRRALKLGCGLLDEPHSFTQSWSGSSGNGEGTGSSRHLATPEKPLLSGNSGFDMRVSPNSNIVPGTNGGSTVTGLGRLQFTVSYVTAVQELLVSILRCSDLPASDLLANTLDSYVKLELLPEKRHRVKTRVVRNTQNPFFGEAFTFNRISLDQLRSISLHFFVVGFDCHSRDYLIGEVLCPLSDMQLNMAREVAVTREILKRKFSPTDTNRGSLLISLCYLPAANRMTVVVLKAEGLPKADIADTSGNPYVKIHFMEGNRRIAKKKTHVKKRTSAPVFNEAFALEIPQQVKLENLKLYFRVVNWERDTQSKVIGHVTVGPQASEAARKQWKTAIETPRRQVAEWHPILA
ncbi:negative regulation of dense core granule exocytosis [Sparganum proliferum]